MAGRRAKPMKVFASGISIQCIQDTFESKVVKVIRCIFYFLQPYISKKAGRETGENLDLVGKYSVYTGYF